MYTNNAYLNNTTMDIKDKSKPLIVTSCGTYHLFTRPNYQPGDHVVVVTFSYCTLHLEKPTFISAKKKRLLQPVI